MARLPLLRPLFPAARLAGALALATVAGCGGGGDTPGTGTATALSGKVAVGAPITGATLRVIDATGTVVASGVAVADDGSYSLPALTGTPPYRLEACGQAGANYTCLYSVAQGPGQAHLTPLTSATVLLAAGQSPEALMTGAASGLGATAVDAAQQQLRNGLAGLLAGQVPAHFDFIGGELTPASRTGYDRVLDAVGVSTGVDGSAFVQITPRLGSGNLYLQPGSTQGSVTAAGGAGSLSLAGLETLFTNMSRALASATACRSADAALAAQLSASARLSMDGDPLIGPAAVAEGLCQLFESEDLWGSRLLSPVLGRCDLSGAAPVCRVSFVIRSPEGEVQQMGARIGVSFEGGRWTFLGDLDPIAIHVSATAQRDRRLDGATPVDSYMRALSVDVPALTGLQCAKVEQRNADQAPVVVAYYKRFGSSAPRLSLWTLDGLGNQRSLDVAQGFLRSQDDSWLALPEGPEGDAVVRNFFRGGRSVTVSLYADAGCSTAFNVGGRHSFEVEIEGVPPVWSAMATLPWPELTAATTDALTAFTLPASASGSFTAQWTNPRGAFGIGEGSFCSGRECGDGGPNRIGSGRARPGATRMAFTLQNGGSAVTAGQTKMLSLYGRNGEGLALQANFISCSAQAPGPYCN
jgi:hypothetical protein